MRVVIDTNVIVSAAVSIEGNPAEIFEMILLEEITNYTTQEIINEVKEVLSRPKIAKRLSLVEQEFIINSFETCSVKINPKLKMSIVQDDPEDNKFIECAVEGKADYIISGDDHLLKIKEFEGIRIVSPAQFVIIKKAK